MELQEKETVKQRKSCAVSEYRPPTLYKIETFTDEITAINLDNFQKTVISTLDEKIFPQSAWCISEDEKFVVSGGFDGTPRHSAVIFNLKSRKKEKVQKMLQGRFNHVLVSCGKYIYAIGGVYSKTLKECEKLCLTSKIWKKIGNLSVARENPGVCVHLNLIYIFGGNGVESVEMYSPYKKKFFLLRIRLPVPGRCCVFPYDSQIFVLQRDRVLVVELGKMVLKEVEKIELKEWWSPTEAVVTSSFVFFLSGEQVFRFAVGNFSVDQVALLIE